MITLLRSDQFDKAVIMSLIDRPQNFATDWLLFGDLLLQDVAALQIPDEIKEKITAHVGQASDHCRFAVRVYFPRTDSIPEDPMEKFIWDRSREAISDMARKRLVIHVVAFRCEGEK